MEDDKLSRRFSKSTPSSTRRVLSVLWAQKEPSCETDDRFERGFGASTSLFAKGAVGKGAGGGGGREPRATGRAGKGTGAGAAAEDGA